MAASYLTVSWKLKERVSFLFGGVIRVRHGERGEGQRFSSSKARRVAASVARGKVTRKRDYLSVKWLVIKKNKEEACQSNVVSTRGRQRSDHMKYLGRCVSEILGKESWKRLAFSLRQMKQSPDHLCLLNCSTIVAGMNSRVIMPGFKS